jgi:hypothetical protein
LLIYHQVMAKHCAIGLYQLTRTHANLCFNSHDRNDQPHPMSLQRGNELSDCASPQITIRCSTDPWENGTEAASTRCGIPLWTPPTISSTCGSMETSECTNADADIDISTASSTHYNKARSHLDAFPYQDRFKGQSSTRMDMHIQQGHPTPGQHMSARCKS